MIHANTLVLVSLSLSLAACVGSVPLEGKPCPCVTGNVCCEAKNQCLAAGELCDSSDAGAATDTNADTPSLGVQNAIGRPCDLSVDAGPTPAVYNASASECPSNLCFKPAEQPGSPMGNPLTQATCSASCAYDSDCDGELRDPSNPLDQRCMTGFACGIPFVRGPLCCKKLCMCKDFLAPEGLSTPIACQGGADATCAGPSGSLPISSVTGTGQETDIVVAVVSPTSKVDIVTMVDNSPSMAPKVSKLNAQFPKLIDALRDPTDGTLPDLRVAIIDGDLGTGGAYNSGSCGPRILPDGTTSVYGDLGRFQMLNPTACGVTNANALWLEYSNGKPVSYSGDINSVFACLARGLGNLGCGEEHQLQAFEFALVASGIGNDKQRMMLRPDAYLGLVFLTDEDDCSAATNDGLFGDKPELQGETPTLRCATRAHRCGGMNLTASPPGYPTNATFTHSFSDCQARTDSCPNQTDGSSSGTDTSVPTDCSPLKDLHNLADEIKSLKADPDQIVVAGIFGWPRSDADVASAQYKIAPVPNPDTADTENPTVYDYWPVCYDPNHMPSSATTDPATGFDATAAGWGATGGLRESAFIDEFGANGSKFSICEPDFTKSMATIGNAIAKKVQNLCVDYKLVDTDSTTAGVQADCRVAIITPATDPIDPTQIVWLEDTVGLPQCSAGASSGNIAADCWQLATDFTKCPVNGQLVNVLRTASEISAGPLPMGTRIGVQCQTCPSPITAASGCDY
jgi:hypothetical protein